jgi:hypothetical protein
MTDSYATFQRAHVFPWRVDGVLRGYDVIVETRDCDTLHVVSSSGVATYAFSDYTARVALRLANAARDKLNANFPAYIVS